MAQASGFTHLHLHSQYSLLDGAIRVDALVPHAKAQGMAHVAVTDHGNMFGALHFYKAARHHGLNPIFGCEAYVAPRGRHDRQARESSHLVLLARDNEGFRNLSYLISMGYTEGFYYHPRIDRELLKAHSRGLIGLSACLGGVVNRCLLREGEAEAAKVARAYAELFEPGCFYLELQDNGLPEQVRANQALMEIARTTKIPLVATADAHYLNPDDSAAHEVLMCIGQGRSLTDFRARGGHSDRLYVQSPEEVWAGIGRWCPEAVENTMRIAQSCRVELELGRPQLPSYEPPAGQSRESLLGQIAHAGLAERARAAPGGLDLGRYRTRLDYELGVITKMGFAGYFLVVWDFIRFARHAKVPVGPGRGSGAGSLVAYCLRITDIDPLPLDLLFERFLNPERVSMPDFDIDFCQDRRGEVIDYVADKYGKTHVGQIVTYSQLSAKSVIKDVGRVLELPFQEVNELTKLIPSLVAGKKVGLEQALALEPRLREVQREKPVYAQVIELARRLEGLNRQTGMHAAGIVIAERPLWEHVPVLKGKDGELVTQFAKDEVEEAGLVKFDFLGLKTLTVIAQAEAHIRELPGSGPLGDNRDFHIAHAPLSSAAVYELLGQADTDGVFQLESDGFKELLKRLRPDRFEDIIAAVALYRPGPLDAGMVDDYIGRKHGRQRVRYAHPALEPVLCSTYGVIVYQEQVMRIAVDLSGFTMGQADILRKAMGKKKADVMAKMQADFVDGAGRHGGMARGPAAELFAQIEKFAGYAFNKSHSAAYALITYQTAYLKAHYPVAFTAALLSYEMRDQDSIVRYIQSARRGGMVVRPPSVNRSRRDFTVETDAAGHSRILFGLGAVKGVGDGAIEAIAEGRRGGPYTSLHDFCERVEVKRVGRRSIEALIKAGACDDLGPSRAELLARSGAAVDAGVRAGRDRALGQTSLFAAFAQAPAAAPGAPGARPLLAAACTPWSREAQLAYEKEALGFYVTGHPLDGYAHDLARLGTHTSARLPRPEPHRRPPEVAVAGVVTQLRERPLRSGQGRMAFVTLEDLEGSVEVVVFSRLWAEAEALFKGEAPLLVRGQIACEPGRGDEEDERPKLRAASASLLAEVRAERAAGVELSWLADGAGPADDAGAPAASLEQVKALLGRHPGRVPVALAVVVARAFVARLELPDRLRVTPSAAFVAEAQALLGEAGAQVR